MKKFLLAALLLFCAPAYGEEILKLQVMRSDDITADGAPITMTDLKARLVTLKAAGGMVWFWRESPERTPTQMQRDVFNTVLNAGLRMSSSSKPDYSNYIGPDGQLHPRQ